MFIPGIEAHLDADAKRQLRHGIARMLERVLPVLCETGTRNDVVNLQNALKNRAELYPSQQRELGAFIVRSPDALCPRLGQRKARRRDAETLFGD